MDRSIDGSVTALILPNHHSHQPPTPTPRFKKKTNHTTQAVTSDMIARYQRVYGREVFFLTGTDEHGQKVAATAEVRRGGLFDVWDGTAGRTRFLCWSSVGGVCWLVWEGIGGVTTSTPRRATMTTPAGVHKFTQQYTMLTHDRAWA
jgi:hypothetical protein